MVLLAWNASNLAGHTKKVTANALILVAFSLGNILGTQTFQEKQAPAYSSGKIAIMACLSAEVFVTFVLGFCNDQLNKKNRGTLEAMSEDEKALTRERLAYAGEYKKPHTCFAESNLQ